MNKWARLARVTWGQQGTEFTVKVVLCVVNELCLWQLTAIHGGQAAHFEIRFFGCQCDVDDEGLASWSPDLGQFNVRLIAFMERTRSDTVVGDQP